MISVSFARGKVEIYSRLTEIEIPMSLKSPFDIVSGKIVESADKMRKCVMVLSPRIEIDNIGADICSDDKQMRIANVKKAIVEPEISSEDVGESEDNGDTWNFKQKLVLNIIEPALDINVVSSIELDFH